MPIIQVSPPHANQSTTQRPRTQFPSRTAPHFRHRYPRDHHVLQRRVRRDQRIYPRGIGRQPAQPSASPGYAACRVRSYVGLPKIRTQLDGHRQEPLQERRSLLGQRLCHAHPGKRPGRRLRVGAQQTQQRAGAPCRSALRAPEPGAPGHRPWRGIRATGTLLRAAAARCSERRSGAWNCPARRCC